MHFMIESYSISATELFQVTKQLKVIFLTWLEISQGEGKTDGDRKI